MINAPRFARKAFLGAGLALFVGLLSGLHTGGEADSNRPSRYAHRFDGAPVSLTDYVVRLQREGERNEILNLQALALAAMRQGHREIAKDAFDVALELIEQFYVDSEDARHVRSLWYGEGCKRYLGEPYERAMAYLYRGILHMQEGEWDDARPCFKAGMLQDAFAEEEQYQCDFALLAYLYGLCSRAVGDDVGAQDAINETRLLMPNLDIRERPSTRYLAFVEVGGAPRKVADGKGHGELKYRPARGSSESDAFLTRAGRESEATMFEDVFYQASTRGGRAVDKILDGKVHFVDQTQTAGKRVSRAGDWTQLGGVVAESSNTVGVGSGLKIIGGIAQLVAANANPHADTRYWDNLPDLILLFELPGSALTHPYEIVYVDYLQRELPGLSRALRVDPSCRLLYCTVFVPSPTYSRMEANQ